MMLPNPNRTPATAVTQALLLTLLALVLWPRTAHARAPAQLPNLSVELHSHMFMKAGLGWLFRGAFDEALRASSWQDRLSSNANRDTLQQSGAGIVVVALFAHPLFTNDLRGSIRTQIAAARAFCDGHDGWALARSPHQARRLLLAGKRVLVLSLEGTAGVLESEADLVEFVDNDGISIVTPLHLSDDRYGGVATMNGLQRLANPLGLVDGLLDPQCDEVRKNTRGLTPLGLRLVAELVARGVWVDLTHASDRAIAEITPLLAYARQPLLFTHTSPRRYRSSERAISAKQLAAVAHSGGMVGLLPSEDAFANIKVSRRYCPSACKLQQCQGSVHALAQVYSEMSALVGAESVVLGSDYNGGIRHLAGACHSDTALDDARGLWHQGLHPEVWRALRHLGAPVPTPRRTLQTFLTSWSRVKPTPSAALLKRARLSGDGSDNGGNIHAAAWPDASSAGPGVELSVSLGGVALPGNDGIVAGFEARILKDMTKAPAGEPAFYYTHVSLAGWYLPPTTVNYVTGYFAPVGVRAQWYDNRLWGDAFSLRGWRNVYLDEAAALQWLALRGGVRTMPGLFKAPGKYDIFVGMEAGVLGYKYLMRRAAADELHAFVPAEAMVEMGLSLWPNARMRLTLFGELRADVALARFTPLYYQSDVALASGARLGLPHGVVEPFVYYSWLGTRQGGAQARWRASEQLTAGARFSF